MLLQSPITYAIQKHPCIHNSVCIHLNVIATNIYVRGGSRIFSPGAVPGFFSRGGSRHFLQGRFQDFSPGAVPGFFFRGVPRFFLSRGGSRHFLQEAVPGFFSRGGSRIFVQGGSRIFLQRRFHVLLQGVQLFFSRGSNFCPHHYRITIPFHIQAVCICFNKRYSRCGSDPEPPREPPMYVVYTRLNSFDKHVQ